MRMPKRSRSNHALRNKLGQLQRNNYKHKQINKMMQKKTSTQASLALLVQQNNKQVASLYKQKQRLQAEHHKLRTYLQGKVHEKYLHPVDQQVKPRKSQKLIRSIKGEVEKHERSTSTRPLTKDWLTSTTYTLSNARSFHQQGVGVITCVLATFINYLVISFWNMGVSIEVSNVMEILMSQLKKKKNRTGYSIHEVVKALNSAIQSDEPKLPIGYDIRHTSKKKGYFKKFTKNAPFFMRFQVAMRGQCSNIPAIKQFLQHVTARKRHYVAFEEMDSRVEPGTKVLHAVVVQGIGNNNTAIKLDPHCTLGPARTTCVNTKDLKNLFLLEVSSLHMKPCLNGENWYCFEQSVSK